MKNRREFIKGSAMLTLSGLILSKVDSAHSRPLMYTGSSPVKASKPLVISTWNHGMDANDAAWTILDSGGRALDAVETGVRVIEADPENTSVGIGGFPDRDGYVTLDACIMDEKGNAGSVCFLQHIVHPVSVARKVMEKTPHVMLAGEGALQFALSEGFRKDNLLTDKALRAWEMWKEEQHYQPEINVENHDTIGMIALDEKGDLAGACTTSGAAFKYHGRVGDSPVIGAGLYVDNEVGGAVATGLGEMVLKTLGSFLIVELMRNGRSPQEACEEAIKRISEKVNDFEKYQVGYLALDKSGETGAYAIHRGFNYALHTKESKSLIDAGYFQ